MTSDELIADFGPYQLVVRKLGSEYTAVLWRTDGESAAQRLVTASGPTLDSAKEAVERLFYEERLRQSVGSDEATYARAFAYLWPKLTERQRQILQAQYRAKDQTLTTIEMAEVAGWKSHSPVNLWYGLAGFALFGEVPRPITERSANGAPVYSFALSTGKKNTAGGVWAWTMRPEVAKGLELTGCL